MLKDYNISVSDLHATTPFKGTLPTLSSGRTPNRHPIRMNGEIAWEREGIPGREKGGGAAEGRRETSAGRRRPQGNCPQAKAAT